MQVKTIDQSPTPGDVVFFELQTFKDNVKCNPLVFEKIYVYYIEKDVNRGGVYHKGATEDFTFKDAKRVMSTVSPLWSNGGEKIQKIENLEEGRFAFLWKPTGLKSGDYIIKWEWRFEPKGKIFSNEYSFHLKPEIKVKNSIKTRYAPRDKYQILMDRYLPQLYKKKISNKDLTPEVIKKLNKCVADGFLELEDSANDLIDILDANFTHPTVLPLLANMFNVKLRTEDFALWRKQIKQAVPLFKKKGTLDGLRGALDQAGINLLKLTKLWQITSQYFWTDSFVINAETLGDLSKLPINNHYEVSIFTDNGYIDLPSKTITVYEPETANEKPRATWEGHLLGIEITDGDIIKIKYQYREMPTEAKEIDDYIHSLPLADGRDETKQEYPKKNWNVRLIEESDPLFDLIIKEKHPFCDPLSYGKIRTKFLFSEKVYNMDTYNGSLRDSNEPCDLDKDFMDECSYGQSSKFNIDIEVENLNDDSINEAKEIIREFSPFHSMLNKLNVCGKCVDFILPPTERITSSLVPKNIPAQDTLEVSEKIAYEIRYKDGRTDNKLL